MDQQEAANLAGRLEFEAEYAIRLWDQAWNGGFERANDKDVEREYLQTAALALNALGNIRLAQAIHRQEGNRRGR